MLIARGERVVVLGEGAFGCSETEEIMFRELLLLLFNYAFCFMMHIISHPVHKPKISPMAKVLKDWIYFFFGIAFLPYQNRSLECSAFSSKCSLGNIIEI